MSTTTKIPQMTNSGSKIKPLKKIERTSNDELEILREIVEASPEIRQKVSMHLKAVRTRLGKKD
jgi:hypothetical protein